MERLQGPLAVVAHAVSLDLARYRVAERSDDRTIETNDDRSGRSPVSSLRTSELRRAIIATAATPGDERVAALPFHARLLFAHAPLNADDDDQLAWLRRWARAHARHRPVRCESFAQRSRGHLYYAAAVIGHSQLSSIKVLSAMSPLRQVRARARR